MILTVIFVLISCFTQVTNAFSQTNADKLVSEKPEAARQTPLEDMSYGNADAPVTIIEYTSLSCPHCADFTIKTFPVIKAKYIDTGKARLILREFPFDPRSTAAFMLARCAPKERYFAMVDVLFKQQKHWATAEDGEAALLQIAKLAGFSKDAFRACLTNQKLLDDLRATVEHGSKTFGVKATPTFIINGEVHAGAVSADEMSSIIDKHLDQK
ncbi:MULTISPECIES: DsbA family protein [Brucella]|uniref:DsbA family protein n=1 Tax=Brucella TaxID=234 RepID=UPI001FFCCEBB|nr:DsbA family protein [Brucella intermedia]